MIKPDTREPLKSLMPIYPSTILILSTIFNHYLTILIEFKRHLNLDLATFINFLPVTFSCLGNLTSKHVWLFNHFWLFLLSNIHRESQYFWVLQSFSHIQSITPKTSIIVPLGWYNLSPYLIMSKMIIKCIYNRSFTTNNIHSRKLCLKLSLVRHNF